MSRSNQHDVAAAGSAMGAPAAARERPILMSGPMVRAILDGRKTVTRRPVKRTDAGRVKAPGSRRNWHLDDPDAVLACPYGLPGDGTRLWVRETHHVASAGYADGRGRRVIYRADDEGAPVTRWTPGIHMPRWASRLTLEIVSVRVERLQDITRAEVAAEGLGGMATVDDFHAGWDRLYRGKPEFQWAADPWVWRVEFRRMDVAE